MTDDKAKTVEATPAQLEREFWEGVYNSEVVKRLQVIGDELNKVRVYANRFVLHDKLSEGIAWVAVGSYYAGVCPLIRLEQTLSISEGLRNEYAYALAARAYVEIAGRVHKGRRLIASHRSGNSSLDTFHHGAGRLLASYSKTEPDAAVLVERTGFNVMTLINSLEDTVEDVNTIYDGLSNYVHGDFTANLLHRRESWLAHKRGEDDPVVSKFAEGVARVRSVCLADFSYLLAATSELRARADAPGESADLGGS